MGNEVSGRHRVALEDMALGVAGKPCPTCGLAPASHGVFLACTRRLLHRRPDAPLPSAVCYEGARASVEHFARGKAVVTGLGVADWMTEWPLPVGLDAITAWAAKYQRLQKRAVGGQPRHPTRTIHCAAWSAACGAGTRLPFKDGAWRGGRRGAAGLILTSLPGSGQHCAGSMRSGSWSAPSRRRSLPSWAFPSAPSSAD